MIPVLIGAWFVASAWIVSLNNEHKTSNTTNKQSIQQAVRTCECDRTVARDRAKKVYGPRVRRLSKSCKH